MHETNLVESGQFRDFAHGGFIPYDVLVSIVVHGFGIRLLIVQMLPAPRFRRKVQSTRVYHYCNMKGKDWDVLYWYQVKEIIYNMS